MTLAFALLSKYTALAFLPLFLAQCVLCSFAVRGGTSLRPFAPVRRFLLLVGGAAIVVVAVYAVTFHWRPLVITGGEHGPLVLLLVLVRFLLLPSFRVAPGEYALILPIAGIMVLACVSTVNLGLRYILPLYPFLFVWLSRVVTLGLFGSDGRGRAVAGRVGAAST